MITKPRTVRDHFLWFNMQINHKPIWRQIYQLGGLPWLAQLVKNPPAGEPSSIPGSGRSAAEGIGYPLQYSWASLVAQLVENLPAMQETRVWPLGWEDPLEKGKATHASILAWRIRGTIQSMGSQKVRHHWVTFISLSIPLLHSTRLSKFTNFSFLLL